MNEAGCTSGVAGDFYELHGDDDSMDEYLLDSSCVTGENIDVSHDYQGRREGKRRRLEAIDLDHDISIGLPEWDKTSSQQSSDMGDRRTIPRAVQKRRADRQTDKKTRNKKFRRTERANDRTPVTGVEDSGSEGSAGTLETLDSQDHHIAIAESESGEETISQESSTSKDRRTRARTVQKRRTHRQTDINTSRSKTRSHIDRPTVRGTPDSSWSNTPFSPTLFSFDEDITGSEVWWSQYEQLRTGAVIMEVLGSLLGQGLYGRLSTSRSNHILMASWLFFGVVVSTGYRGSLIASLTIPRQPSRPETLEELVTTVDR
ncbi:hypothetical protein Pmani_015374 [Petrolisthes manimaculis]|uniref:Uncharacterized protein n=1 Tax=Petrolisthes manimaculis TaxID=1843537 RepID=A0AAE1PRQ7_9EUCA|nr:hypothetical protein Pmani_015374 [Petrolisthes manimaculis]